MNIIDLGIISILLISVLVGMYYGFSVSLFKIASFVISWFFSLLFHPSLTRVLTKHFPDLVEKIIYFSEGSSKTSLADRLLPVSSLSQEQITRIIKESGLPNPFSKGIRINLIHQNLQGLDNLGQYFDYTVANIILNLISFILIFLVLQLLFMIAISIINNITTLPVLKKYDNLSSGILGFFRGLLFLFVIFAFMPLLYLVLPAGFLNDFLDSSKFVKFFINANFFTSFIKGVF